MSDEWVNAVITVTVPMALPHHATNSEKLEWAEEVWEVMEAGLPEEAVCSVSWEDAPVAADCACGSMTWPNPKCPQHGLAPFPSRTKG